MSILIILSILVLRQLERSSSSRASSCSTKVSKVIKALTPPHLSAAWQHAFDDVTPSAALAFASTGIGFGITGVPLAEDSALIDAGLDLALGPNATAGVSYSGQFGDGVQDSAVKGRFAWQF